MFKLKKSLMANHVPPTPGMGGMGGGAGGGGGGGMGGGEACFIYPQGQQPQTGTADITFQRSVYMNGQTTMADGNPIVIWGFRDTALGGGGMGGGGGMMQPDPNVPFPSPLMRLTQGQIAHTVLDASGMGGGGMGGGGGGMGGGGGGGGMGGMWKHTIHHHGIEPEYRSDGVGHTSWDISSSYIYQWSPQHAGTYFYHCHVNTVLHVEMCMYGALIVDPPEGRGVPFAGGGQYRYQKEAIWVVDEIDSSWHKPASNWPLGTCGRAIPPQPLNDLNPDYFIISGRDGTTNNPVAGTTNALNDPNVAVTMNLNETLLVRYINAGYLPQTLIIPQGLTATVIASDGRPVPAPWVIDGNSANNFLETTAAERYDLIIKPTARRTYMMMFLIMDWVTNQERGRATTKITVN